MLSSSYKFTFLWKRKDGKMLRKAEKEIFNYGLFHEKFIVSSSSPSLMFFSIQSWKYKADIEKLNSYWVNVEGRRKLPNSWWHSCRLLGNLQRRTSSDQNSQRPWEPTGTFWRRNIARANRCRLMRLCDCKNWLTQFSIANQFTRAWVLGLHSASANLTRTQFDIALCVFRRAVCFVDIRQSNFQFDRTLNVSSVVLVFDCKTNSYKFDWQQCWKDYRMTHINLSFPIRTPCEAGLELILC
jgi:hypothetical protein